MRLRYTGMWLVLLLLVLGACAPAPPADVTGTAGEEPADAGVAGEYVPVPRAEAVIINETGTFSVFSSYNPFVPSGDTRGMWQAGQEHLFNINWATGEFVNWLGESYSYNDDYTQMTIITRPEAHWNDGEPFTSADVAFTIEMVKADAALRWGATMQEWVDSVETPDAQTVVINLTKPNPRFHMQFANAWGFAVQAKHVWEGENPLEFKNFPPVLTGPYTLMEEFPDQFMIIWEKDENYWAQDLGYEVGPQYYVIRNERVPEAEIADLKVNKIDHAHALSDSALQQAAMEANENVILAGWRDPCPRAIWFNTAKYPLSLPEVRHAFNAVLNRQKAADLLFGVPTVPARFPWADWGVHDSYSFEDIRSEFELGFDPARAEQILDDLGFERGSDGIRVDGEGNRMSYTIITPSFAVVEHDIALDLTEELEKVGIETVVQRLESGPFNEARDLGTFDITSHWFCGNWAEGPMTFADWKHTNAKPIGERATAGNWIRLNVPELTEIMAQIESMSPNDPAIEALYREAVRIYFEQLPGLAVVQTTYVMPFNATYWEGWPTSDNVYAVPFTWWPEFKFVMFNLTPAE